MRRHCFCYMLRFMMSPRIQRCALAALVLLLALASSRAQAPYGTGGATTADEATGERLVLRPTIPAYFPGCGHIPEGTEEKSNCSTGKLMGYIARSLRYPDTAREQRIEGVTMLSFVVGAEGDVRDVRVLRDIGGGCGAEARRVLEGMPTWQPAIHKGRQVATQFTLPITFGLRTGMFDYVLHVGDLPDGDVFRRELLEAVGTYTPRVTDPRGEEMLVTEVVYTFERGGERTELVTRGADLPDERAFARLIHRKGGRLTIEANVVDGLDIRTVTRGITVLR